MNANAYLKKKTGDEATFRRKRKRLEKTISRATVVEEPPLLSANNQLAIIVKSSDGKKQYAVTIHYTDKGIKYECNCGDQFGLKEKRNCCKHVATVVLQLNKTFLDNHIQGEKIKPINKNTMLEIVNMLERFDFN